ncbi:hypothetical protein RUM_22440 [Ruminococcus champanellensis 18P13 = JCM 17042]|uniref:Uncharacterized protein n=1 Tax=Ruminococcus champanellensis (strain DSM 18848 / JCM 17042 / KCTC 15320 / 18P13) TaxID=213810 RepID=D4LF54_RUMC1|nr:hypothetical protein RUM_22440 [Ruminococcus champanellensis 18P13 = JCM 17042]DAZ78302.1 MAG TPA: hypothetical protein [Caudoviricetes sp.]
MFRNFYRQCRKKPVEKMQTACKRYCIRHSCIIEWKFVGRCPAGAAIGLRVLPEVLLRRCGGA